MAAHDSHPARAPLRPRLWLRAFVGFYRPQPASQRDLDGGGASADLTGGHVHHSLPFV